MVNLICGNKGSGKTSRIIEKANADVKTAKGDCIFVNDTDRYMYDVDRNVKLIDITEYPVSGEDALLLKLDQPFTWYHREVSHAFLSGNLVHYSCPFPLRARALRKEAPFRTELFFQCTTLPQRRIYSGAIEFGIHAESARLEESLLFLRHLLSEPVQARLLDLTGNLPFRRSVLEEFAARNESFRNLYAHISCFRAIPERIMNTFWSGKYSHNATILSILREHADPVQAAKANADEFFRVFPEYHKQNTIKQKH